VGGGPHIERRKKKEEANPISGRSKKRGLLLYCGKSEGPSFRVEGGIPGEGEKKKNKKKKPRFATEGKELISGG